MRKHRQCLLALFFVVALACGPYLFKGVCDASEPFPLYPCIRANVAFWKKVYAEYPTTRGLVHDNRDLSIVYEVIDLKEWNAPNARRINRKRMKRAVNKYAALLRTLASNPSTKVSGAGRVAALFGPGATAKIYKSAASRVRCQVGQRDRFREGLIRSGTYIGEIKRIFASNGLPVDLAYLPHVESSFNHKAYSRFGAAGIWQFTHSTAKRFMKVDYTLDERWDPILSTHAAARLLKENYQKLGTWPLALTAYNHGVAGMMRAKKSKGDYPAIFRGYRGKRFKFASRNFYSEFLAARQVARDATKYFSNLQVQEPVKIRDVKMKGYASAADLSRFFEVDEKTLRDLNPALRRPVFRGLKYVPKGYVLKLPATVGDKVTTASLQVPSRLYKSRQKRSLFYRVQRGDTAGKIARANGVKLSDLIMTNNLDHRARIYAGQNLRIPARDENIKKPATAPAREKKEPAVEVSKPAVRSVKKVAAKGQEKRKEAKRQALEVNPAVVTGNISVERLVPGKGGPVGVIRVGVEETLGHYAEWLDTPIREIRKLNDFKTGKMVRINEAIQIPLSKVSKEQFEEKRFEYHKEMQEDFYDSYRVRDIRSYRIKTGDSLWRLCLETFEVPLWLFNKYNPDLDINNLKPAQEILIPIVDEIG